VFDGLCYHDLHGLSWIPKNIIIIMGNTSCQRTLPAKGTGARYGQTRGKIIDSVLVQGKGCRYGRAWGAQQRQGLILRDIRMFSMDVLISV